MKTEPHFIQVLKFEYERRVASNGRYSLRAFARDLDMSAPLLSGLFKGKKGLSEKKARKVCQCLELNRPEAKKFILSVISSCSRSPAKRAAAAGLLARIKSQKSSKLILPESSVARAAGWVPYAILELCELPECRHSVKWFSKKLGLNEVMVERLIQNLLELGQLQIADGRYKATSVETATEMEIPSPVRRRLHAEILDRAKHSLAKDSVKKREFISMTLAFSESDLDAAKDAIREFQEEFAERFYYSSNKKRNSVYQLSTQLFPLTESEKKNL